MPQKLFISTNTLTAEVTAMGTLFQQPANRRRISGRRFSKLKPKKPDALAGYLFSGL